MWRGGKRSRCSQRGSWRCGADHPPCTRRLTHATCSLVSHRHPLLGRNSSSGMLRNSAGSQSPWSHSQGHLSLVTALRGPHKTAYGDLKPFPTKCIADHQTEGGVNLLLWDSESGVACHTAALQCSHRETGGSHRISFSLLVFWGQETLSASAPYGKTSLSRKHTRPLVKMPWEGSKGRRQK